MHKIIFNFSQNADTISSHTLLQYTVGLVTAIPSSAS
jgi:hypothetical protein